MDTTGKKAAIAVFFMIGTRLAILYLERLDAKQSREPDAERRAIEASRRRAQGHLWLLGAFLAGVCALLLLAPHGPPAAGRILAAAGLAGAAGLCAARMARAYGDSRRIAR